MSQTHNTFSSLSKDFDVDALHRSWNQGSLLIKIVL